MNDIFMCFSVPYTSCHSSQPKGQKRLGKLGFWGEKEMMMGGGGGPNSFDTNKQTNKILSLLTYLLPCLLECFRVPIQEC